ncbi:MAG TPA: ATP-binding protein [Nitriliruptorales bacterium]|nr:ATP-binding protein [Nitriliruptorales bacterium]
MSLVTSRPARHHAAASADAHRDRSRWLTGPAFTAGFAVYGLFALLALAAGLVSALALPLGWHDALHDLGFTRSGLVGRVAEAMADAAHNTQPLVGLAVDYGFSLLNVVLAGFLLRLRPRRRTAPLAIALIGTAAIFNLQAYSVYEALDLSVPAMAAHVGFHVIATVAYCVALLQFPDGRLVPRWSRARQTALYVPVVLALAAYGGVLRGTSRVLAVIMIFGLLTPAVGVAAQAYRYRTAQSAAERQQARTLFWALTPALLLGVYVLTQGLTASAFEAYQGRALAIIPTALFRVFQPVFAIIPVALFAGLVRFKLWDVDRVISRALMYGVLAAFVTLVYVGVVVGLGRLVGARGDSLVLPVLATGVIAVAFEPVQRRVKRLADRLVYGRRADPYEVLAGFSERMADSVATTEQLSQLARILAEGTAAGRADVWVVVGDEVRPAAFWPEGGAAPAALPLADGALPSLPGVTATVPVRHDGELLGALAVTLPGSEVLGVTEERLVTNLAGQVGLLLRNVRLTAELLDRLEELRDSRRRLVAAQDETRRRIERDLHDGAQQQLVALRVKLALAERLALQGQPVGELLHGLGGETADAIDTLRDLARGIYPPLLADRGLAEALQAQAAKVALPVTVDTDAIRRYAQEVEAAVYFCCLEALQNVAKYADASHVAITLREEDGQLAFTVSDDGRGFDPARTPRGSGLQNMADRLDALDGSIQVRAAPGHGTTVAGRVPVEDQPLAVDA